ncbi:MAG: two-component system, OmpR family, sensor kinase [Pyrinomonadaceae bacterium]|jgi:heavy metal sensor kinase|nr:two-component system, OmpR family, sensor kinase [Pyrinomonadaceae bacterium]
MNKKPLGSMRVQLTLWYTGFLALVLLIFSITTYSYLSRSTRQREDDSLAETANSFISNFNSELTDENQGRDGAARETARSFRSRDRQVIIYSNDKVVVASDNPENLNLGNDWFATPEIQPQIAAVFDPALSEGRAYRDIFIRGKTAIRVLTVALPTGDRGYIFVFANSLRDQEQALEQAREAFYIAIPIALVIASLGGYFLARKSLAPVVTMGERAARIGASNLDERIPVPENNQELGRLAGIFNKLLARLDQSFAQQKRFMADASHELRTPVAVICGESEVSLSREARDPSELRESLAIVNDEGRRLTRMVEDLFTLARADAGEYPLVLADFYLDESVNESVRSVRSLAAQKGLEVFYQPPAREIPFRGDEALVQRMVLNLIHNAIKYTPAHGRVQVAIKQNHDEAEIVISDTGPGIPADARAHVFERFYRADKARSRDESLNGSGAGLGLSIAKWVAELHGGTIVLDNTNPEGATFIISLPNRSNLRLPAS